ncbi:E3 ubiquitin-protein ligase XIAP-like [Temnothorax longispinosus]|uniref:E3 ubiquitin-protein ligase XIAP-like n=1 Tax=Temnothorax longispinosus TaxID=300112 RepID=UPI003A9A12E1
MIECNDHLNCVRGVDVCGPCGPCGPFNEAYLNELSRMVSVPDHPEYVSFAARIARGMASGPKHPEYKSYATRLASFDRWPKAMSQTKETLATAGFYYTGGQTLCHYCGRGLSWEPEDDPWVKHAKWFAYCPYLILTKGTEFVSSIASRTDIGAENILSEINNLGKHPRYASYATRLVSFDRWPKAMSQTKETLATAGFYYTGSGDQTLCYQCGGGINDWESEDDPWVEHAKWYEHCPYLILTKGTEFVSSITGRMVIGAENIICN